MSIKIVVAVVVKNVARSANAVDAVIAKTVIANRNGKQKISSRKKRTKKTGKSLQKKISATIFN